MSLSMSALRSARPVLGKSLLLAAGLVGAALALRTVPLAVPLHELGTGRPIDAVNLVVIGAILCAVGVPRQVVAFAAGYGWGLVLATALALAAQLLGCAANLFWARALGRQFIRRRLGRRIARIDVVLAHRPFAATLALRLLPVGNNLVLNLIAGVSSIRAVPFLAASAIGYLPQTIIFVLLGQGSRIGRGTEVAIGVALLIVSALLALWIFKAPWAGASGRTGETMRPIGSHRHT